MRHPRSTSGSGCSSEGSVAVGYVDVLVVERALGEAVPEDFQPAVPEGTQRVVMGFPGGDLGVVELPGPAACGEAAERPLMHGVTEVVVVREPAGDDEIALAGASGDRGGAGVALQPVRGVELADVLADLTGDPSCEAVSQAGEAQVDDPPGNAFPGSGSCTR